ncbi:hypothetical protein DFJ77DRAFT_449021 [Powellomyces hirtus]|nr:hypothetical protein DFJ77DRAFT_449021 [Powellomyces hirtus]
MRSFIQVIQSGYIAAFTIAVISFLYMHAMCVRAQSGGVAIPTSLTPTVPASQSTPNAPSTTPETFPNPMVATWAVSPPPVAPTEAPAGPLLPPVLGGPLSYDPDNERSSASPSNDPNQ